MSVYAVIRVRGSVKTDRKIRDTLQMLNLRRINHCVLLAKNPTNEGMLQAVDNFVTWGEIDTETQKDLVSKKGMGKIIKPFRLSPPSGGHKPIKLLYPKGACGYRGEKINELLARMI